MVVGRPGSPSLGGVIVDIHMLTMVICGCRRRIYICCGCGVVSMSQGSSTRVIKSVSSVVGGEEVC